MKFFNGNGLNFSGIAFPGPPFPVMGKDSIGYEFLAR